MKRLNLSIEKYESSLLTIPEIDLDVEYYKSSKFRWKKRQNLFFSGYSKYGKIFNR